jgi:hypothetical protein
MGRLANGGKVMRAIEIEKLGPDLYPVLIFRVDGEVIRIVRCKNENGILTSLDETIQPVLYNV